jgi:peptidoglycan hydrolase-like protein with peptidoglycan-binding domain
MKSRTQLAQQILKEAGLYRGKIDGDAGPKTKLALAKYPGVSTAMSLKRQIVACIQMACKNVGIDPGPIDGYWGPSTENAVDDYLFYKESNGMPAPWRPEERESQNPNNWPKAYTSEFDQFYGPVGDSNLTRIQFPYPMKIAWNPSQKASSTLVHRKVADSAQRIFQSVLKEYGQQRISDLRLDYFGGCYNKRSIRGGTKWSMHSWGVAFDFDPSRNRLKWGRDKASFAKPEYDAWWKIWEDEGWVSLGRERNFDWMHVQAATL